MVCEAVHLRVVGAASGAVAVYVTPASHQSLAQSLPIQRRPTVRRHSLPNRRPVRATKLVGAPNCAVAWSLFAERGTRDGQCPIPIAHDRSQIVESRTASRGFVDQKPKAVINTLNANTTTTAAAPSSTAPSLTSRGGCPSGRETPAARTVVVQPVVRLPAPSA